MKTLTVLFIFSISCLCLSQSYSVEFRVNMSIQLTSGKFDPASDKIVIRGNFQTDAGDVSDWSGIMFECKDADNDSIYTLTINLPAAKDGTIYEFKYVLIKDGVDNWERISNRTFILTGPSLVFSVVFFNDVSTMPKEIELTFACNMEYETSLDRFDPANDSLFVSGDFNGWSATEMKSNISNPNYYYADLFYTIEEGQTINYKFAYKKNNDTIWENDPNKIYTFTSDDYINSSAFIERIFNDLCCFPKNWHGKIKFTVNTNNARSALNGNYFTSIDNVVLAGYTNPLRLPSEGWPTADSNKVLYLNDNGISGDVLAGDGVWSREINFENAGYEIFYKYGINFGLPTNEGGNENEAGLNIFHKISIPYNPYDPIHLVYSASTKDTFGVMEEKPLYDIVYTGIDEKIDKPLNFSLSQNFPNPFNPTTTINYEIADPGFVSLKIFNTLGQEVETLVNEFKQSGNYNVEWSIANSHLSSSVYFYQLTQGSNSIIKKMILLR